MKALITAFALLSFVAASTVPLITQAQAQTEQTTPKKKVAKKKKATKKVASDKKKTSMIGTALAKRPSRKSPGGLFDSRCRRITFSARSRSDRPIGATVSGARFRQRRSHAFARAGACGVRVQRAIHSLASQMR